jgi:hypothetical protein
MAATQKLVSFFLHDKVGKNETYGDPEVNVHFGVQEHLAEYLEQGWSVKELTVLGGAGGCLSGWVVVLLDKRAL